MDVWRPRNGGAPELGTGTVNMTSRRELGFVVDAHALTATPTQSLMWLWHGAGLRFLLISSVVISQLCRLPLRSRPMIGKLFQALPLISSKSCPS